MRNQVCAVVESDSKTAQKQYSEFLISVKSFICAVVQSKSKITQMDFLTTQDIFPSVLQWEIHFVLLLS